MISLVSRRRQTPAPMALPWPLGSLQARIVQSASRTLFPQFLFLDTDPPNAPPAKVTSEWRDTSQWSLDRWETIFDRRRSWHRHHPIFQVAFAVPRCAHAGIEHAH